MARAMLRSSLRVIIVAVIFMGVTGRAAVG
jgi:hypothetical protein